MLAWEIYFQSPEYLELYRKKILDPDYLDLIIKWLHLKNGMKILEVGCGTGEFSFYLAQKTIECKYYGIDINEVFINAAALKDPINKNQFIFKLGNALDLPFEDNFFDLVISYTALTNIPNSSKVMSEMVRVTKKGGYVASITSQSFEKAPSFEGEYPLSHKYYFEYKNLKNLVNLMYESIQPVTDYIKYGTAPEKIPLLFSNSSLTEIEMHAIGVAFSLSNATLNRETKRNIIHLEYLSEIKKFNAYKELKEFNHFITPIEAERYLTLLQERRDKLLEDINENKIWEWFGRSQLLMVGKK